MRRSFLPLELLGEEDLFERLFALNDAKRFHAVSCEFSIEKIERAFNFLGRGVLIKFSVDLTLEREKNGTVFLAELKTSAAQLFIHERLILFKFAQPVLRRHVDLRWKNDANFKIVLKKTDGVIRKVFVMREELVISKHAAECATIRFINALDAALL